MEFVNLSPIDIAESSFETEDGVSFDLSKLDRKNNDWSSCQDAKKVNRSFWFKPCAQRQWSLVEKKF